jgi:hypothetical protein
MKPKLANEFLPLGVRLHVYKYLKASILLKKISKLSKRDRDAITTSKILS